MFWPGAGLVLKSTVADGRPAAWTATAMRACPVQKHSTVRRTTGVLEHVGEAHAQILAAEHRFLPAAEDELLAQRELHRIRVGFVAELATHQR